MKLQTLKSIIEKKKNKSEFAIITNLKTGESEIFEKNKPLSKELEKYSTQINDFFKSKKIVYTVNFRFKHVRFKEVFRFKEEFHCFQNFST